MDKEIKYITLSYQDELELEMKSKGKKRKTSKGKISKIHKNLNGR